MLDDKCGESYSKDQQTWCGGSGLMIALDVYGDIYPCIRYTPSSIGHNQPLLKIGDVEHGFIYTKEQEELLQCMKCITRATQVAGTKCEDCPIAQGCGDCAAYSYEVFGEIGKRTDYICDTHKARVLAAYYYAKKARQGKDNYGNLIELNCPAD